MRLIFSRSSRVISTHIRSQGHAVFQFKDKHVELRHQSSDEVKVDGPWITKTGLVTEGLAQQPYIHLDIRTPFGESVGDAQVETALAESLGPSRDKYRSGGWHLQFVEDTNLGSNHRVFVDLIDLTKSTSTFSGMDAGLALEVAVEALGEIALIEKGEPNFQLLLGGKDFCYSLLFINGSAFHVLRVNDGVNPNTASRLRRHREFVFSQGKLAPTSLKTLLYSQDPLNEFATIKELQPLSVTFGIPNQPKPSIPITSISLLLHLGLAHAVKQRDLFTHNRVAIADQVRNNVIRSRHSFLLTLAGTVLTCALIAGAFGLAIYQGKKEVRLLTHNAEAYSSQVNIIRELRKTKTTLERDIAGLRPLWNSPIAWPGIFSSIASALPEAAGMDGLSVMHKPTGEMELSFRTWVKDWDQVQMIQRKLSTSPHFSSVNLSEQRKDLSTGVVVFTVNCNLARL